jgi:hypothetical protein
MDTVATVTTLISTTGTINLVLNWFLGRQDMGVLPAFSLPFFEMIKTFKIRLFKIRH